MGEKLASVMLATSRAVLARRPASGLLRFGLLALAPATMALAAGWAEDFDSSMAAAMARMHAGMEIAPSGDPDRDFAAMMIPHHEGAIAMARAELLHGKDERLRRLAQKIIVEQGQEIETMRQVLASRPGTSKATEHKSHPEGRR